MNEKRKAIIRDWKTAFEYNFGDVRIEEPVNGKGFYVYYPASDSDDQWMDFCKTIDELNAFLRGCVKGAIVIKPKAGKGETK